MFIISVNRDYYFKVRGTVDPVKTFPHLTSGWICTSELKVVSVVTSSHLFLPRKVTHHDLVDL